MLYKKKLGKTRQRFCQNDLGVMVHHKFNSVLLLTNVIRIKNPKLHIGMYEQEWGMKDTWSNPSTLLNNGFQQSMWCLVLGTALHESCGPVGESPKKNTKNDQRSRKQGAGGNLDNWIGLAWRKEDQGEMW